ncbi:MAG: hypothetical protein WHX93_04525 [bacterium]
MPAAKGEEEDYHQLAAAQGLSLFFRDIGHIAPPPGMEHILFGTPLGDLEDRFVDKEQG